MSTESTTRSDFVKFDSAMNRILGVSHKELQHREAEWKRNRKRRKRSKSASRAARA
jgi:hypothetical protein